MYKTSLPIIAEIGYMTKAADVVVGPDGKSHYVPNHRIEAIAALPEHQRKTRFHPTGHGWIHSSFGFRKATGDQRLRASKRRSRFEQFRRNWMAADLKDMRRRQQAYARLPNTPWKRVKGFGGKALGGVSKAGGYLFYLAMIKQILGKDDETKYLEDRVRWAQFAQQANERYNKAMYPEYFT